MAGWVVVSVHFCGGIENGEGDMRGGLPRTTTEPVANADKKRDDDSRYVDGYLDDGDNVVVLKSHGVVLHQVGAVFVENVGTLEWWEKGNVEREGRSPSSQ